jgi:hypothetical protein
MQKLTKAAIKRAEDLKLRNTTLRRLDCTEPRRGPWITDLNVKQRAYILKNRKSAQQHKVYYGTRTGRTQEDAEAQAVAMCAVLNVLKSKTC